MPYIDKEDLLAKAKAKQNGVFAAPVILNLIEKAPEVDVVEVVRRKNCKYRYVPCHCALWYGTADGKEYFIERGDGFSCSYGKKKEGAENDTE